MRTWEEFVRDVTIYAPDRWRAMTKQGRREMVPPLFHLHFPDKPEVIIRADRDDTPVIRAMAHAGGADAVAIFFEAWAAHYEKDSLLEEPKSGPFDEMPDMRRKPGTPMPSEHPNRMECLWLIVQVRNGDDRFRGWMIESARPGKPGRKRRLREFSDEYSGGGVKWPTFDRMLQREKTE